MGSPAKIIRKLTKAEITANITNAQRYVQNGIRFKTSLLPVA
ncbi:hypothetical protein [Gilliamella bombi]|nr:hypothetical protein [Gilliamella bombi]